MQNPQVNVNLIVYNGEKYIRRCLGAAKAQSYPNVKFRIFDNASEDNTLKIAQEVWPEAEIVRFDKNYILGGGFNRSLYYSEAPYVVGLSVDVAMAPNFIERAVVVMEKHKSMGVLQAKIYRYNYATDTNTNIIDTTGMQIFRSRRIINRGHGEEDRGQYNTPEEIFCYEGAVPFFRREALEDTKMLKNVSDQKYPYEYLDEDFVWYADEVDLGWRMRLMGWGSWYEPSVIAWHDRQTTHKLSGGKLDFIAERRLIPALKKRLDLQNQRLAFIKNDFTGNILRDIPFWLKREFMLVAYALLFERSTLRAYLEILKKTPLMVRKRQEIMGKRRVGAREMRKWFL